MKIHLLNFDLNGTLFLKCSNNDEDEMSGEFPCNSCNRYPCKASISENCPSLGEFLEYSNPDDIFTREEQRAFARENEGAEDFLDRYNLKRGGGTEAEGQAPSIEDHGGTVYFDKFRGFDDDLSVLRGRYPMMLFAYRQYAKEKEIALLAGVTTRTVRSDLRKIKNILTLAMEQEHRPKRGRPRIRKTDLERHKQNLTVLRIPRRALRNLLTLPDMEDILIFMRYCNQVKEYEEFVRSLEHWDVCPPLHVKGFDIARWMEAHLEYFDSSFPDGPSLKVWEEINKPGYPPVSPLFEK